MRAKLYDLLIRRVKRFYEMAKENYNLEYYDLALVHLEQALQLFLKAKILEKFGKFPKTHNLKELFKILGKELKKEDLLIVDLLEDAYIGGRYMLRDYSREECEMAFKFVEKILNEYGLGVN